MTGHLERVDLNLLYTLHEVVTLGGVTAAARALGRTQPAISARLRQLESQLGVTLLERAGRTVRLTPVGRAVFEEIQLLMGQLAAVLDRTHGLDAEPVGTLRVGALPTLCAYLLAPVAAQLTARYPRARVHLLPGSGGGQIDQLRSGDIDVLISVGRPSDRGIDVTELGSIEACLVVPTSSPFRRGSLSWKRLRGQRFIVYGRTGDPFFDAVATFLRDHDLDQNVGIEVANIQAIKQLVLLGAGLAVLPRYTIVEPSLTSRRVAGLDVFLPLCVATRPGAHHAPAVRELLRTLEEETRARGLRSRHAPAARSTRR